MNGVDRVKAICKERKIPISKLERDLGYANGYIGQLRKGVFPSDRLLEIAEYLSVSHTYILTGEENKKAPTEAGERSVSDAKAAFFDGYGDDLSEEEKDELWEDARVYAKFKAQQKK